MYLYKYALIWSAKEGQNGSGAEEPCNDTLLSSPILWAIQQHKIRYTALLTNSPGLYKKVKSIDRSQKSVTAPSAIVLVHESRKNFRRR